jgi:hypothetical protein
MTKRIGRKPRGAGRVSGAVHKVSASPNALTRLSSVDDAGTQAWSPSAPGFEYIGCATFLRRTKTSFSTLLCSKLFELWQAVRQLD